MNESCHIHQLSRYPPIIVATPGRLWALLQAGQHHVTDGLYLSACCSVLQCVAVCCSVLQCVAVCCRKDNNTLLMVPISLCVAVCYSVLPCVAVCCRGLPLQRIAMCCRVLKCITMYCSVLQCVAVRCSVVQCVAVCCRRDNNTLPMISISCVSSSVAVCYSVLRYVAVCSRRDKNTLQTVSIAYMLHYNTDFTATHVSHCNRKLQTFNLCIFTCGPRLLFFCFLYVTMGW